MGALFAFGLIVVGGAFGGIISFVQREPNGRASLPACTLTGIAAAAVVPVFLQLGNSPLLDQVSRFEATPMLVLFGFCILASLSGKRFLNRVMKSALGEANEAKQVALDAKATADKATRALVAESMDIQREPRIALRERSDARLDPDETRILDAFMLAGAKFLSADRLAKMMACHTAQVSGILETLRLKQVVDLLDVGDVQAWYLTLRGRALALELAKNEA